MADTSLKYWLALRRVSGLGNVGFLNLLNAFGSPDKAFAAPLDELQRTADIGPKVASRIKAFSEWPQVEKELALARDGKVSIINCRDRLYPQNLLNIYDFPPFIYVRGTLKEDDVCIAVVGSRLASPYGKFSTERLCRELALEGITTVSGLARGIDTAAHRGSLAAKGRTIAVLGCGIDIVYPPENRELFEKICTQGAVITEFPFGTPPLGPNFPARNRIISGLALGVVVVEANYRSGSLITARVALEQGREVFAVPGSIDSEGSKGTNKLIKEGAKLVEGADDILEEILPQIRRKKVFPAPLPSEEEPSPAKTDLPLNDPPAPSRPELTAEEARLLQHIAAAPLHIDDLVTLTGTKAGDILNNILLLELKGLVRQLPGKMYVRKE